MGNKVNVAFINAKIRLADAKFGNQKDKKLTADETEAIEFFKNEIEKAKSYISDETYNAALKEIMGFEPSASSSEEPAKASTTESVEKKASVTSPYERTAVADSEPVTFETNKKDKFKLPDDGLNSRKGEEKEFLKRLNSYASIEGLVANLSNDVTNSKYDNVKKVAFFFANEIQKMDIKTEADIKTIKSKIKSKCKNCNGYNADILNAMVKIAEKELIDKETSELAGKYNKVKKDSKEIHFSNYEKGVEDATTDKEYHPESRKRLKFIMEAEANTYVDKYHRNTDGKTSRTSAYKTKSVRKQIQARVPKDDKFLRDVIKKDKVDNRLEGRYNKYNDITEKIKDISSRQI